MVFNFFIKGKSPLIHQTRQRLTQTDFLLYFFINHLKYINLQKNLNHTSLSIFTIPQILLIHNIFITFILKTIKRRIIIYGNQ